MNKNHSDVEKIVGQTRAAGIQVGVRRTFLISLEQACGFLTSEEGIRLWIGDVESLIINEGESFISREGDTGQFVVVKPHHQVRLRWRKKEWEQPSTLQIRLVSNPSGKTTISFHQEKMVHPEMREQMKMHWEEVLNAFNERTRTI